MHVLDKNKFLHSTHGDPVKFGKPAEINGKKALAYMKGDKVIAYTPLEEINEMFYRSNLPQYKVEF